MNTWSMWSYEFAEKTKSR